MSKMDPNFRRNLLGTVIGHGALIAGLVFWEAYTPKKSEHITVVDIVPAASLGDLPVGAGRGTGAHRAPEPATPPVPQTPSHGANNLSADEQVAPPPVARPQPPPVAHPVTSSHDIALPTRPTVRRPQPQRPPTARTAATTSATSRRNQTTARQAGATRGPSADDFRRRLASALGSSEGGSALGDGRAAGGGDGSRRHGRLGHPDGARDGVVGGVGQGSPYWQYFLHVHDRMYEAWEKPNQLLDKNLRVTVLLRIASDGTVNDVTLKRSSGNKVMDETALTAARRVARLNPPPEALVKGAAAPVTVDFELEG
jgi:TonB family protein